MDNPSNSLIWLQKVTGEIWVRHKRVANLIQRWALSSLWLTTWDSHRVALKWSVCTCFLNNCIFKLLQRIVWIKHLLTWPFHSSYFSHSTPELIHVSGSLCTMCLERVSYISFFSSLDRVQLLPCLSYNSFLF